MTVTVSAAKAANGEQMRAALDEQAGEVAGRSIAEKLSGVAGSVKNKVLAALRTLRLGGVGDAIARASKVVARYLGKGWTRVKGVGLTNIAGTIITTPLRRPAVKAVKTVAKVVSYPVRLVGRGIRWGLSRFGWGRKAVAKYDETVTKVAETVNSKVEQGLQWLERNDNHGAMTWLRWFFQASLVRKAIRMAFPQVPGWAIYAAALAIPVYGDKVKAEEEAIEKAHEVLDKIPPRPASDKKAADKPAAEQPKGQPTPKRKDAEIKGDTVTVALPEMEAIVLTDTDPDGPMGAGTFEAHSFIDPKGIRRIYLGEQLLREDDLPDTVTVVGVNLGQVDELIQEHEKRNAEEAARLEAEVRASQAINKGRPPTLPRRKGQPPAKKAAAQSA